MTNVWINDHLGNSIPEIIRAKSGCDPNDLLAPKRTLSIELTGVKEVCRAMINAAKKHLKIGIFGDYDVDGVTSTAILVMICRFMGVEPFYRLPHRMTEGYGISVNAVRDMDVDLLITVDNGIVAHEAVKAAKEKGMQVIIIDHHLPGETLPEADIIVDPHICPEKNGFVEYCGAGLALKVAELILYQYQHSAALASTSVGQQVIGRAYDLQKKLTALAAIGTIADVMPLLGDNRIIVKNGLQLLSERNSLSRGVEALLDVAGLTKVESTNVAFKIAPMLNAPGRMLDDGAEMAVSLLISENETQATALAEQINKLNETRKTEVTAAFAKAEHEISENCMFGDVPLLVVCKEIPEGIVGIITGKLAEKYKRPAFVFSESITHPGVLKGSGRSYGDVNLMEQVVGPCSEFFTAYGGHAGAAGISLNETDFDAFAMRAHTLLPNYKAEETTELHYDADLKASDIPTAMAELDRFAPFGEGNPMPVFRIVGVTLSPRYGSHFKYLGKEFDSVKLFGAGFTAVCFGMAEDYRRMGLPLQVEMVGSLSTNYFSRKPDIQVEVKEIKDAMAARQQSTLFGALKDHGVL